MDYFFVTASEVHLTKEDAGYQTDEAMTEAVEAGKMVKCMAVKCTETKLKALVLGLQDLRLRMRGPFHQR